MPFQTNTAEIHVLQETLAKIGSLSLDINSLLDRVSSNAENAEKALTPISNRTKMFNTYSKNLTSSLAVIDEIKDYAKLTGRCESVIREGPAKSGLTNYIEAIDRLRNAHNEMNKSQLKKFFKVTDKIELLIKNGNNQLKDYFRSILAKSYEPFDVKDYIEKLSKSAVSTPASIRLPILSNNDLMLISQLFEYFTSTKQKVDDIYVDMATRHISTSLLPLNKAAKGTRTGFSKGQPYEKGSSPLNIYTSALGGFVIARAEDLSLIFNNVSNDKLQIKLIEEVMKLYLDDFIGVISYLNDFVTKNMQTESLLVFEIVHSIVLIISSVQVILKVTPANLSELMIRVKSTAKDVFVEFLRSIETQVQNLTNLPSDNGATGATVEVLKKLTKLSDYRQSASASIENLTRESWIPKPTPPWVSVLVTKDPLGAVEGPWSILSAYFSDAIDALILTHEIKAKSLGKKDPQEIGILMLSNLAIVETFVKKTDMLAILSKSGADRIIRLRKRGTDLYLESWNRLIQILMRAAVTTNKTGQGGKQQLSSKDRDAIKEKFKTFNAEFDALVSKQKAYNITNPHLKQELVKAVSFVCPAYHIFYDKHIGGDFSKNVDKYIKYDKKQFDNIVLNSLG